MSAICYTDKGQKIELAGEIGRGGEGTIYAIQNDRFSCAKIYNTKISATANRKIELMVKNPPRDPAFDSRQHRSITWPSALLYADAGMRQCAGFVMPKVDIKTFKKALNYFDPRDRLKSYGGGFTWKYLYTAAFNIASAVAAIHERDYCIGDLNESNILIAHTALITLIDCDSFQARDAVSDKIYRCTVGKPEYTAPELQGKSYQDVDRTVETDCFALAILIFQLLMEGTHPYQAKGKAVEDAASTHEKIIKGYFPYSTYFRGVAPPDYAPPFEILHSDLQQLFQRCFVDGHKNPQARPTAAAWFTALKNLGNTFKECRANKNHAYLGHLRDCPWCQIFQKTGKDTFPSPIGQQIALGDPTQSFEALDKRIDHLRSYIAMALADGIITSEERKHLVIKGQQLQIPQKEIEKIITAEIQKSGARATTTATAIGTPILEISRNHFEFDEVRIGSFVSHAFTISNGGGGILSGPIQTNKKWLKVSQSNIDITRHKQNITISIDSIRLPLGFRDTGIIEINSNGGTAIINVDLAVEITDTALKRFRLKLGTFSLLTGAALGFLYSYLIKFTEKSVGMWYASFWVALLAAPWAGCWFREKAGRAILITVPATLLVLALSFTYGDFSSYQIISIASWAFIYSAMAVTIGEIAFKAKARGIKVRYVLGAGYVIATMIVFFIGYYITGFLPEKVSKFEILTNCYASAYAAIETNLCAGTWKGKVGSQPAELEIYPAPTDPDDKKSSHQLEGIIKYSVVEERLVVEILNVNARSIYLKGINYQRKDGKRSFLLDTFSGTLSDNGQTMGGTYLDDGGNKGEWFVSKAMHIVAPAVPKQPLTLKRSKVETTDPNALAQKQNSEPSVLPNDLTSETISQNTSNDTTKDAISKTRFDGTNERSAKASLNISLDLGEFLRAQAVKVENNFIILNIGQIDGLKTGMLLNIYRPIEGANPLKFLATTKITETRDHLAVVKIVAKYETTLAVGENWMVKIVIR